MNEPLDLISGADAARILDVDPATVSRWSNPALKPEARKLHPVGRVGGYKVFRRADVLDLKKKLDAERKEAKSA